MNPEIIDILRLLRREIWEKRRLFAFLYIVTSMTFLVVGWYWPKVYASSSTILADQQNILKPLMAGTAVTTEVLDRAKMAREIIFSRHSLDRVVTELELVDENTSELEKERVMSGIEYGTRITNAGPNLIQIEYANGDAEQAFKVTQKLTEIFIEDSLLAKQRESQAAFEFINKQATEYQRKLQEAEEALKQFHSENIDARPGTQTEVNSRIVELRRRMESTQLEIRELEIKRETLRKQLSGEAAVTASLTREGQIRSRLADLEEKLGTLRLSYLDTYPDIVQLKNQIAQLEDQLERDRLASTQAGEGAAGLSSSGASSSLYQDLRSQFSATETQLASLYARLEDTKQSLVAEEERMVRINDVEAKLAELTRDYDVNQDLYQQLLKQRENARISMNIDRENQGLTFKVQEPAALELTPDGIRFSHFLAAGVVCSFMVPVGLIYVLTMLDPRVRSSRVISDRLGLPILASVYHINTPTEYNLNNFKKSIILMAIIVSWAAYGYAAWLRVTGGL